MCPVRPSIPGAVFPRLSTILETSCISVGVRNIEFSVVVRNERGSVPFDATLAFKDGQHL